MIKHIFCISLLLLLILSICGCDSSQTDYVKTQENTQYEVKNDYYVITTDYMTFHFSIDDFDANEIWGIKDEAVEIMRKVQDYLNVSCNTLSLKESTCYFDSSYVDLNGKSRSYCFPEDNVMYCISPYDFVHEYVHMVIENNTELVYHPSNIFREGFAQYIGLNFFDDISSDNYSYFKSPPVSENSNEAEHNQICKLIADNDLEYNAKSYLKAFVSLYSRYNDISLLDTNSDFYNYYVGCVVAEYCINELGGLNKFISAYCDSVMFEDIYGKTLSEVIKDACTNNDKLFK